MLFSNLPIGWRSQLVSFDSIVLSWSFLTIDSGGFSLVCFGDTLFLDSKGIVLQIWLFITNKTSFCAWSEYWWPDLSPAGHWEMILGCSRWFFEPGSVTFRVPPASLPATATSHRTSHCNSSLKPRFNPKISPWSTCIASIAVLSSKSEDGSPSQSQHKPTVRWPCDPAWRDLRLFIALLVHRILRAMKGKDMSRPQGPVRLDDQQSRFASKCWRSFNKDWINTASPISLQLPVCTPSSGHQILPSMLHSSCLPPPTMYPLLILTIPEIAISNISMSMSYLWLESHQSQTIPNFGDIIRFRVASKWEWINFQNSGWTTYVGHVWYTLWLFNIAMENGPFIDGLPIKNGDFLWLC